MLKKLALAAAITLATIGGLSVTAPAEAGVRIYFGVPFHPYPVGPGWRYYDGYGWYDYDRFGPVRPYYDDPYVIRGKLTCGQARRLVDRRGYDDISARDCAGRTYAFRATNKKGKRVTVFVDAYSGDVWR